MKITLEFEEQDLRKMITDHFTSEGFNVKNLDEICNMFGVAFPQGIKVEADIVPLPVNNSVATTSVSRLVDADETYDDGIRPQVQEKDDDTLSFSDLMDPTPRIGRTEATRKKGRATVTGEDSVVDGIDKLVRLSRNLEKQT